MVHVDESALLGEGGKSDLPIESVRRVMCDGSIVAIIKDANGNPLDVGRKHRVISTALRRALSGRDKRCRYPGCSHDRWLNGHHVKHWIDGGETSLENTLLLCTKHHRLLHEGGYTIEKNFEGNLAFKTRNGKVIPELPMFKADYYDNPSRDGFESDKETRDEAHIVREPLPMYVVG